MRRSTQKPLERMTIRFRSPLGKRVAEIMECEGGISAQAAVAMLLTRGVREWDREQAARLDPPNAAAGRYVA